VAAAMEAILQHLEVMAQLILVVEVAEVEINHNKQEVLAVQVSSSSKYLLAHKTNLLHILVQEDLLLNHQQWIILLLVVVVLAVVIWEQPQKLVLVVVAQEDI
jgi:hypothetical protein